jgi:hypothetical protein
MQPESTRPKADGGEEAQAPAPAPVRKWFTAELWTWLLVGVGALLRLWDYGRNRPLYIDEKALLKNLIELSVFDFHTTLTEDQLAAPAFLVVERLLVRLPLSTVPTARLVPLLCGIASMFLMRWVARRFILPRGVPIAVGLFALNDWLLYYASELKQYSGDVALTLVAFLLAAGPSMGAGVMSRRRLLALAGFGVAGVWLSHPLALVLGGVGSYLVARAALRGEWKNVARLLGVILLWVCSFRVCFVISYRILSKRQFLWDWWGFAFLPFPPRSIADLERDFWHVVNLFNNPSWVVTPLGVLTSAFVALALFLLGGLSMGLRWRGGVYVLVAPIFFTLVASALRQYPFHGRLLLFLIPSVHLLVSEGAAALSRRGGAIATFVLGAFLLVQPAGHVLWFQLVATRNHGAFDSHGDLFPDVLDYLEQLHREVRLPRSSP